MQCRAKPFRRCLPWRFRSTREDQGGALRSGVHGGDQRRPPPGKPSRVSRQFSPKDDRRSRCSQRSRRHFERRRTDWQHGGRGSCALCVSKRPLGPALAHASLDACAAARRATASQESPAFFSTTRIGIAIPPPPSVPTFTGTAPGGRPSHSFRILRYQRPQGPH